MQQAFQPAALLRVLENALAQYRAVQLAVSLQYLAAEMLGDLCQGRAAGLHHPARGLVGIHQMHAKLAEMGGDGTLAAADAARKSKNPGFVHLKPANCR
ncbi:hypothetical protein D3C72_1940020 [compost metagenome]